MSDGVFLRPDPGNKLVEARLAKAGIEGVLIAKRILNDGGHEIANKARRIVPHKKGILMGSIWSQFKASGGQMWVEIGAGGPARAYAERMHYDTTVTYSKPGKRHHYLEEPRDELGPKIMQKIFTKLGKLLGL